jgi:hypothetical protein
LNKPEVAVGDEPEIFEKEPNDTPLEADAVSIPVTINGHIDNPAGVNRADDDYFRFSASKDQQFAERGPPRAGVSTFPGKPPS